MVSNSGSSAARSIEEPITAKGSDPQDQVPPIIVLPPAEKQSDSTRIKSLCGSSVSIRFKIVSAIALLWYFSGFFLPIHVSWNGHDILLNAFSGAYLIPLFGIYRYRQEVDLYQKKRILWIVVLYELFWVLLPALFMFRDVIPQLDGRGRIFPAVHYVESISFFLFFIPVLLLGRRADCGWCCPCVASRETFAGAFRDRTLKGDRWYWLRYLKWINVALVFAYLVTVIRMPETAHQLYGRHLYAYLLGSYFLSFIIIPWTGSRNFCRWGCPWGGIWGLAGYFGRNRLRVNLETCTSCGMCDKVCDMGIPVQRLIRKNAMLRSIECMGCGRCVGVCPNRALTMHSPIISKLCSRKHKQPPLRKVHN
ncbi:MAG: 4Fe-4S binding protein [Desulfuromonadales bacterium]|nr:4Fe-4S binding protein [Desulfuromonadales bacterium]